jgi:hypothetical protein
METPTPDHPSVCSVGFVSPRADFVTSITEPWPEAAKDPDANFPLRPHSVENSYWVADGAARKDGAPSPLLHVDTHTTRDSGVMCRCVALVDVLVVIVPLALDGGWFHSVATALSCRLRNAAASRPFELLVVLRTEGAASATECGSCPPVHPTPQQLAKALQLDPSDGSESAMLQATVAACTLFNPGHAQLALAIVNASERIQQARHALQLDRRPLRAFTHEGRRGPYCVDATIVSGTLRQGDQVWFPDVPNGTVLVLAIAHLTDPTVVRRPFCTAGDRVRLRVHHDVIPRNARPMSVFGQWSHTHDDSALTADEGAKDVTPLDHYPLVSPAIGPIVAGLLLMRRPHNNSSAPAAWRCRMYGCQGTAVHAYGLSVPAASVAEHVFGGDVAAMDREVSKLTRSAGADGEEESLWEWAVMLPSNSGYTLVADTYIGQAVAVSIRSNQPVSEDAPFPPHNAAYVVAAWCRDRWSRCFVDITDGSTPSLFACPPGAVADVRLRPDCAAAALRFLERDLPLQRLLRVHIPTRPGAQGPESQSMLVAGPAGHTYQWAFMTVEEMTNSDLLASTFTANAARSDKFYPCEPRFFAMRQGHSALYWLLRSSPREDLTIPTIVARSLVGHPMTLLTAKDFPQSSKPQLDVIDRSRPFRPPMFAGSCFDWSYQVVELTELMERVRHLGVRCFTQEFLHIYGAELLCVALDRRWFRTVRQLLYDPYSEEVLRTDLHTALMFVGCERPPVTTRRCSLRHVLAHVVDRVNPCSLPYRISIPHSATKPEWKPEWRTERGVFGFSEEARRQCVFGIDMWGLVQNWHRRGLGYSRVGNGCSYVEVAWLATIMPMLVQGLGLPPVVVWRIATFSRRDLLPPDTLRR